MVTYSKQKDERGLVSEEAGPNQHNISLTKVTFDQVLWILSLSYNVLLLSSFITLWGT